MAESSPVLPTTREERAIRVGKDWLWPVLASSPVSILQRHLYDVIIKERC